uniref:BURP domain protein n=1 Tax=Kerria japonica TaxID=120385 RepID=A0A858E7G8_9ROSA|nr:BURP domain protein [Kerria japonica]
MACRLSLIFAFLCLTLVACHAALSPQEVYWNSVFPQTPMPKTLSALVQPAAKNFIRYKKVDDGQTQDIDVAADNQLLVWRGHVAIDDDAAADNQLLVWRGHVAIDDDDAAADNQLLVWRGHVAIHDDAAADNQLLVWRAHVANDDVDARNLLRKDPSRVLVFLEKDVHPGKTMKYSLIRSLPKSATFLPRNTAESIPFSSSKLLEILIQFSVQPKSVEANAMTEAILKCEVPAMRGEAKYCATSLESMIDFVTSRLGRNIRAISTEVEEGATHVQNYTIYHGVKKLTDKKVITCHRLRYPYVVFYCHELENTSIYMVPLKGADGTNAKAITTCHEDTSEWDPKSFVLQLLKVKPGTDPVCHFLSESDVVWVSNHGTYKPA